MSLVAVPGGRTFIGQEPWLTEAGVPTFVGVNIDAANEAYIITGHVITSDGGSHTIDTTGSSSIGWRTGSTVTFANAGTTVKVGLAAVDTTAGPPARAVNAAGVITFDVAASFTGGGGGIAGTSAWQTSVPTTGTKTIANGDYIAFAIQMTALGGADIIALNSPVISAAANRPTVTTFTSATYTAAIAAPGFMITFSDGALGWLAAANPAANIATRAYNSSTGTNEYGQLFQLPFPVRVSGVYGWQAVAAGADYDVILYTDPLGTPVAAKTVSVDANTIAAATGRKFEVMFPSPYTLPANTPVGAVLKPTTANNVTAYYKTLANAAYRVVDPWGTSGYGISRGGGTGAFANANSSLDQYYFGLVVGAYEHGVSPTYGLGI